MDKEYEKNIKPVLDVFDRIREILRFQPIELPKIVVVGDQSSGKSSVLESITGVSLPRGENTVTRCPIILQMRSVTHQSEEYASVRIEAEAEEEKDKIPLKNLNDVIEFTQKTLITQKKMEITDTPIYVKVRKIGAPDLTLYDLPGMTYKNEELTIKVREIYKKYSAEKKTLVLLIIPANSDFTTSEAILIIKKNEDYRERTLGIVTKIDLAVHTEKNLYKKIMFNELDLNFKPIVVRNRTQDELEGNEDFEKIRQKEIDLINSTDLIKLPDECKGTDQLILKLIQIQKEKLLSCKFEIKEQILERINHLKKEKSNLPLPAETITEKIDRFKECLSKMTSNFSNLVSGKDSEHGTKYNLGSRLREKFHEFFSSFQKKNGRFFSDVFRREVKDMIRESKGLQLPNFFDPSAFHLMIKKEIDGIELEVMSLLDFVKDYVKDVLMTLCNSSFKMYPTLNKAIQGEIKNSINDQADKVDMLVKELIECEKEGEWTVNPYYMDMIGKITTKISEKNEAIKKQQMNNQINSAFDSNKVLSTNLISNQTNYKVQNSFVEINDIKIFEDDIFTSSILNSHNNDDQNVTQIQISCFAYWKVFEKRFIDYYELIIIRNLVYFYQKDLGLILEKKFSPNSSTDNFITEDFSLTKKRHELEDSIKNLEAARDELSKIL